METALKSEKQRLDRINDHSTEEPIDDLLLDGLKVDVGLVMKLKPHQRDGIQFMWHHCYGSIAKLEKDEFGSGCILAHCMGLGTLIIHITYLISY